jgi:AcrR family transcriptional regulator
VDAAPEFVEAEGFDALTMRRIAAALQVSPGALDAHVRDKAELDDLMIGEPCSGVTLPEPDPARWRTRAIDVYRQLRDRYPRYPGIARVALEAAPYSLDALRLNEGLLAILLAGQVAPRSAAWTLDAAFQYVGAYSLVWRRRNPGEDVEGRIVDRAEVIERYGMPPRDRFPLTVTHARELTSGEGHDRFDFTLALLFGELADIPAESADIPAASTAVNE